MSDKTGDVAICDYLHKKQIEKAAGVKNIQTMYRE